jgi:hypothetical protein
MCKLCETIPKNGIFYRICAFNKNGEISHKNQDCQTLYKLINTARRYGKTDTLNMYITGDTCISIIPAPVSDEDMEGFVGWIVIAYDPSIIDPRVHFANFVYKKTNQPISLEQAECCIDYYDNKKP